MRYVLAMVLAFFVGFSYPQQPKTQAPEVSSTVKHDPTADAQKSGKASNKNFPSSQISPSIIDAKPSGQKQSAATTGDRTAQIAEEDLQAQKDQATYAWYLVWVGAITGALLIIQLVVTRKAVKAASDAAEAARNQASALMRSERAYIICGGLYGREKPSFLARIFPRNTPKGRQKASDYQGPWRLQISNYGRSMGVITRIEWGICPEAEFDRVKHLLVSEIIERNELQKWMKKTMEIKEPFPAMEGTAGIPYRHIECEREVGTVFFGRITYTDIFWLPHYSTFSLLHKVDHSDSIGRSYAEDWN